MILIFILCYIYVWPIKIKMYTHFFGDFSINYYISSIQFLLHYIYKRILQLLKLNSQINYALKLNQDFTRFQFQLFIIQINDQAMGTLKQPITNISKNYSYNYQSYQSMKKQKKGNFGRWSRAEQNRFIEGLEKYGTNWIMVQKKVKTRTLAQVRSHAQKVFLNNSDQDINKLKRLYKISFHKKRLNKRKSQKVYGNAINLHPKVCQLSQKGQDNLIHTVKSELKQEFSQKILINQNFDTILCKDNQQKNIFQNATKKSEGQSPNFLNSELNKQQLHINEHYLLPIQSETTLALLIFPSNFYSYFY